MKLPSRLVSSPLLAVLALAAPLARADVNSLQRSFTQPLDNAKPMARWWWFGPAVTKPELEREMNVMKQGGFGGFEVQPVYPMAVDGEKPGLKNLKFLSPEFFDVLNFTAAKAKELNLRMDLTLGSGWPYGGPMFTVDEAAGRVRPQSVPVTAGQASVPAPALRAGESYVAAYLDGQTGANPFREVEIRDNAAQLPPDATGKSVLFFIGSHTGMQVKRPAYGAEGYVIDSYSTKVVDKFIHEIAEPELKALGSNLPYAVFCDSLEVAGEDWTADFLAEFQKRRGYDLRPWLPALTTEAGPRTKDIRHDWGQTLTELYNENFVGRMTKWSEANHTKFRVQGYGTPPAALFSYAYANLPEGEGFGWKSLGMSRWAASASHLLGQPITSSETWTWLHSPVFRATPLDMKAEADLHFLQGINQLIAHGWPYTPETIEYPGWRLYASAVFDEKNPWWIVMPDITAYLQRMSSLLRQGTPANDVALYLADSDAWASFTPGRVAMNSSLIQTLGRDITGRILDAGYNLDFFDDGLLDRRGKVDGGSLAFGDVHYKIVVLAGVERIPLKTMRQLEQFAKNGGVVVATRRLPALAPGFKTSEADSQEVAAIAQRLFKAPNAPGVFVENESDFAKAVNARLKPDAAIVDVDSGIGDTHVVGGALLATALGMTAPAPEIGVVHRHTDGGEVYFLANTGNTPKALQATFRVSGLQPEWWDPMTGKITPADVLSTTADTTTLGFGLEAYGSQVLVFTARKLSVATVAHGALWTPMDLSTGWTVTFGQNGTPQPMNALKSWTEDEATKHFSGVATYRKSVEISEDLLKSTMRLQLNFGETKPATPSRGMQRMQALVEAPVREAAVVYVNGQRAGSVWHPPYALDVTGLLKAGSNDIRIEVANLAVNMMASQPIPDYRETYKAVIAQFGDRFQPQDMNQIQPITAGLLGPIRLIATARVEK